MKTWVRKTLSVGVLAAGALLFAPGAANADVRQNTGGNVGILNGTQIAVPVSVPVNVVGNSLGILGVADARGVGVNMTESGRRNGVQNSGQNFGILNGTQAYLPVSVPVNVVGNAASVAGYSSATGVGVNRTESTKTTEHGWRDGQQNSGQNFGIGNGTQIYAPVDVPINVCGNSLSILGGAFSNAVCANNVSTHRGGKGHWRKENTQAAKGGWQSSGQNFGIGNGTQLYAPISLPVNLAGNSAAVLGAANSRAVAVNESGHDDDFSQNSGQNFGILNGTQIAAPISVPINVCGNSLGILGAAQSAAGCVNGSGGHGHGHGRGDWDGDWDGDHGHGHGKPGHGHGDHDGDWDGDGGVKDDDDYKGDGGVKDDDNDGYGNADQGEEPADNDGDKGYGQGEEPATGSPSNSGGGRKMMKEASPVSDLTETVGGVGSLGLLNTLR